MASYFLTGCTGFIGREIVRQLIALDDTEIIVCLTRGNRLDYIHHPKVSYWIGNVTDCTFPTQEFSHLIHGATDANDLLQPDLHQYYYVIVEGTNRVLKFAECLAIPNVLLLSSGAVSRDTVYGRAKRQCEFMARQRGFHTIARIFSVIGPEMPLNGQFAAGQFIGNAIKDGSVRLYGGESVRSYLHIEDCARWLLQILNHGHKTYDVAGDEPIKVSDLAIIIADIWGAPLIKTFGPDREDIYLPDLTDANLLGCVQTLSLRKSLELIHQTLC